MKFFSLLVCCLFVGTVLAQNTTWPSATIKDLNGAPVDVQKYAQNNKKTIISFWATWCIPCKKELDAIAEVYPDWVEDYNVELIAINIDNARSLSKVKPMVSAKNWEYEVLSDANQDLMRILNFQTVPYTFLLDESGKIVYEHTGYLAGDEYELEDKLKELSDKDK